MVNSTLMVDSMWAYIAVVIQPAQTARVEVAACWLARLLRQCFYGRMLRSEKPPPKELPQTSIQTVSNASNTSPAKPPNTSPKHSQTIPNVSNHNVLKLHIAYFRSCAGLSEVLWLIASNIHPSSQIIACFYVDSVSHVGCLLKWFHIHPSSWLIVLIMLS